MDYSIYLSCLALIIFSLFLGFLSAIPVGAVQLDVAKKAINGHLKPAIAVALGSVSSDFIYGVVTLFGLGSILLHKRAQIFIYSLGIVVILVMLYRAYREYRHTATHGRHPLVYTKRISFFTGFTMAITNPGIMVWWIIGFKILHDLNLFEEISAPIRMLFIVTSCAGLGGYLIFIAIILHRVQKNFPDRYIDRLNIVVMVLFVALIIYFAYKVVLILCGDTDQIAHL